MSTAQSASSADAAPSLDVLPDLIPDASPMSDPSLNSTPAQDSIRKEYFTSKADRALQHDLPFRPNITRSIIASQVEDQRKTYDYNRVTINGILSQELNPTHAMFNSVPFVPTSGGPCFANPAQSFWYRSTITQFSDLLEDASYSPTIKAQYMDFFNHFVVPALGPIPSVEAPWTPHLTHDASPFEPSWNVNGQEYFTPNHQIGFTFEPIGPLAGTGEDPFNQLVPAFFVSSLASSNICPNLDLGWWYHFMIELFVPSGENQRAYELLSSRDAPPTCFLAFDLPTEDFAPVMKPYLFPQRRALLDGKTNTEVLLSAVMKLHSPTMSLLPAVKNIETFLSSSKQDLIETNNKPSNLECDRDEMSLEMVSFDCIHTSENPRIKLYLKTHNTSFSNIKHIYTFGGERCSPETGKALELFKQFWECLTGLEGEWKSSSEQTASFLYFGLEIAHGREIPDVKIYIPAWACGVSDQGVREGLKNFFLARGWGLGEVYEKMGKGLTHTYLSLAYDEEKGVNVTMSYSPVMERL
ncbi:aromatic prenyltransferase [Mollisia scopiformis]|uniref:Aromatic prenyltransferase n=1 Tax=Mollisia scopiformis TaxID=149040 RepID=A0A132B9A2_MOLSC|nr:aromatic prenyltransferase [Mollisia scopiformis]KUJ08976.1 aromatic prenyltransferase [Mollisia scopiformis]